MVEELFILIVRGNQKECSIVNRREFDDVRTSLLKDENSQASKWIEELRSYCNSRGKPIPCNEFERAKKSFAGDIRTDTEYLEEYATGDVYG